jgi:hypothetical protein
MPPPAHIDGVYADAATVGHGARAKAPPAQALNWLPNSYYRLRDPTLIARIVAVEAGGMRGEIFPAAKLKWVNGCPGIPSDEMPRAEEWDLRGNSTCDAAHDLMELIR